MADITYCENKMCPFKDCERHQENKHIEIYKRKSLTCYYVKENGMLELYKIEICGKELNIPHWLRKRLRF